MNNCELGALEDYTTIIPSGTPAPSTAYTVEYDGCIYVFIASSNPTSRTNTKLIINNISVSYDGGTCYNNDGYFPGGLFGLFSKGDEIKIEKENGATYSAFNVWCRFYKKRDYSNR